MKRIDGTVPQYYAVKHDLTEEIRKSSPAHLVTWVMFLPGQAIWNGYALSAVSLADFPGLAPANKGFPEATHELIMAGLDPKTPKEILEVSLQGRYMLVPFNYVAQFTTTDEVFLRAIEEMIVRFVNGDLPAEPEGVRINMLTAREYFKAEMEKTIKTLTE